MALVSRFIMFVVFLCHMKFLRSVPLGQESRYMWDVSQSKSQEMVDTQPQSPASGEKANVALGTHGDHQIITGFVPQAHSEGQDVQSKSIARQRLFAGCPGGPAQLATGAKYGARDGIGGKQRTQLVVGRYPSGHPGRERDIIWLYPPQQFGRGGDTVLRHPSEQFGRWGDTVLRRPPEQFDRGGDTVLRRQPEQFDRGGDTVLRHPSPQLGRGGYTVLQYPPEQFGGSAAAVRPITAMIWPTDVAYEELGSMGNGVDFHLPATPESEQKDKMKKSLFRFRLCLMIIGILKMFCGFGVMGAGGNILCATVSEFSDLLGWCLIGIGAACVVFSVFAMIGAGAVLPVFLLISIAVECRIAAATLIIAFSLPIIGGMAWGDCLLYHSRPTTSTAAAAATTTTTTMITTAAAEDFTLEEPELPNILDRLKAKLNLAKMVENLFNSIPMPSLKFSISFGILGTIEIDLSFLVKGLKGVIMAIAGSEEVQGMIDRVLDRIGSVLKQDGIVPSVDPTVPIPSQDAEADIKGKNFQFETTEMFKTTPLPPIHLCAIGMHFVIIGIFMTAVCCLICSSIIFTSKVWQLLRESRKTKSNDIDQMPVVDEGDTNKKQKFPHCKWLKQLIGKIRPKKK